MSYEEGVTVLAMREGDSEKLFVFGEGVFVGDRLMPGTPEEGVPPDDYEAISAVLEEDDLVPVEEHRFVVWFDEWIRDGRPVKKTREQVIAEMETERARPMAERVRDLYLATRMNPCIYLDSGDIVWGYQCWWAPVSQTDERFPTAERILVPVPEGNGRWK
jgi:hypothetical protein